MARLEHHMLWRCARKLIMWPTRDTSLFSFMYVLLEKCHLFFGTMSGGLNWWVVLNLHAYHPSMLPCSLKSLLDLHLHLFFCISHFLNNQMLYEWAGFLLTIFSYTSILLVMSWHTILFFTLYHELRFSSSVFLFHAEDIKIRRRKLQSQRLILSGIKGLYLPFRYLYTLSNFNFYFLPVSSIWCFDIPRVANWCWTSFHRYAWRQMKEMSTNFSQGLGRLVEGV